MPSGLRRIARPLSPSDMAALRHTSAPGGVAALPKLHRAAGRGGLDTGLQGQVGVQGRHGLLEGIRNWLREQSISGGWLTDASNKASDVSKASEVSSEARSGPEGLQRVEEIGLPQRERPDVRRVLKAKKRVIRKRWGKRTVRRGRGQRPSSGGASGTVRPVPSPSSVLKYFGGPVAVAPIQVHLIYYGNWTTGTSLPNAANSTNSTDSSVSGSSAGGTSGSSDSGQGILRDFLGSISPEVQPADQPVFGSVAAWWKVLTMFGQKDGQVVSSKVTLASETYDNYTEGASLENDREQVFRILQRHFDSGKLQAATGHMYLVLTSPDVTVGPPGGGFCGETKASYCGWHDVGKYSTRGTGGILKPTSVYYGFVGNPATQCPNRCMTNGLGASPNGNPGIDAMVDTLAHELAEMATNPDTTTGWMTSDGEENADICRGEYYLTHMGGNFPDKSYLYNVEGTRGKKYLVQAIYNPVKAACAIAP